MNADSVDAWVDAIREREQLLGKDAVHRMAEMFVEEIDALLSQALQALHDGNADAARKAFHHLCGNAGCLDFHDLEAASQDAERACVHGLSNEAMTFLSQISPLARHKVDLLRRRYRIT